MEEELDVLASFLSMRLSDTAQVFDRFSNIEGSKIYSGKYPKEKALFIEGSRRDKILFVAHADTVWDKEYINEIVNQKIVEDEFRFSGINGHVGIGADDRAGCAILWLLRNSGHSILITDGEEKDQIGSNYIKQELPELYEHINKDHCFAIQLDLSGSSFYKCYNIPVVDEFVNFVEHTTGYTNMGNDNRTDICVLCKYICGVNLSTGYYRQHTLMEHLKIKEWLRTYKIVKQLASGTVLLSRYKLRDKVSV